jgi:CheY-like chemotaxis protein
LDMHLPKRGGEEIIRSLRASKRCGQTRVVIMTSSDAPADHKIAESNAVAHYFRKPTSLDQFLHLGKIVKDALATHPSVDHPI